MALTEKTLNNIVVFESRSARTGVGSLAEEFKREGFAHPFVPKGKTIAKTTTKEVKPFMIRYKAFDNNDQTFQNLPLHFVHHPNHLKHS